MILDKVADGGESVFYFEFLTISFKNTGRGMYSVLSVFQQLSGDLPIFTRNVSDELLLWMKKNKTGLVWEAEKAEEYFFPSDYLSQS